MKGDSLIIKRPIKFGGDLKFETYEKLKTAVVEKKIHPLDIKMSCLDELLKLLSKIEEKREYLEGIKKRAYPEI
jgi:tyrosyl-tRNA synthetase